MIYFQLCDVILYIVIVLLICIRSRLNIVENYEKSTARIITLFYTCDLVCTD